MRRLVKKGAGVATDHFHWPYSIYKSQLNGVGLQQQWRGVRTMWQQRQHGTGHDEHNLRGDRLPHLSTLIAKTNTGPRCDARSNTDPSRANTPLLTRETDATRRSYIKDQRLPFAKPPEELGADQQTITTYSSRQPPEELGEWKLQPPRSSAMAALISELRVDAPTD